MLQSYDGHAAEYDTRHSTWLRYAGGTAQAAFEAAAISQLAPGMRLLDAGAGTGAFARHLLHTLPAPPEITLLDRSAAMLQAAADLPVARIKGCLMNLPFPTHSFNLVTAAWSIETTPVPARAIHELLRVLTPGGCVVTVFCSDNPVRGLHTRLLRESVRRRGFGRFLSTNNLARVAREAAVTDLVRLRAEGPATVLMMRKPTVRRRVAA